MNGSTHVGYRVPSSHTRWLIHLVPACVIREIRGSGRLEDRSTLTGRRIEAPGRFL